MRSVIRHVSDFLNALVRRRARSEQDLEDEIQFHLREEARLRADDGKLGAHLYVPSRLDPADRSAAVADSLLMTTFLDQFSYAQPRFSVVVMTVFAIAGLLLVAIGVFSIIAYTVSRRTHEIGIRMALGAQRTDVVRMVLGTTLRIIGFGIVIGLTVSLILTRVFANQLFGVAPQDPPTVAAVVALLVLVGLLASYIPTHQASRVDPMIGLRHD